MKRLQKNGTGVLESINMNVEMVAAGFYERYVKAVVEAKADKPEYVSDIMKEV